MRVLTPAHSFPWQWEVPRYDAYVGACLMESGVHSIEELDGLARLVPAGGRVLDGGANVGALTIPLAAGGATVVAVEPQVGLLDCLTATAVRARVLPRVVPVFGALSDGTAATVRVPQPPLSVPLNFGAVGVGPEGADVPAVTVDQLAAEHGPFAVIKLDLEGHEPAALAGASATLAAGTAVWCVEVDRPGQVAAIVAVFQSHGYALHRWSPPLAAPWDGSPCPVSGAPRPAIVSHNLLAVPAGRTVPLPVGATPWD